MLIFLVKSLHRLSPIMVPRTSTGLYACCERRRKKTTRNTIYFLCVEIIVKTILQIIFPNIDSLDTTLETKLCIWLDRKHCTRRNPCVRLLLAASGDGSVRIVLVSTLE